MCSRSCFMYSLELEYLLRDIEVDFRFTMCLLCPLLSISLSLVPPPTVAEFVEYIPSIRITYAHISHTQFVFAVEIVSIVCSRMTLCVASTQTNERQHRTSFPFFFRAPFIVGRLRERLICSIVVCSVCHHAHCTHVESVDEGSKCEREKDRGEREREEEEERFDWNRCVTMHKDVRRCGATIIIIFLLHHRWDQTIAIQIE